MASTRPPLPCTAPLLPVDPDRAERAKRAMELDLGYVFHSWPAQDGRQPFTADGAQVSWWWDGAGTAFSGSRTR
ncbi:hypothetical protein [Kineosporia sp. NBRC 101731]|uniref:hypothetical protein n=1 Tax=Kineosporia sp. NBRC 101731 TaxID=3032199 RepID=UPI002557A943|nr:hypothetical protein [Kineosporia sp. NBRC 101731]